MSADGTTGPLGGLGLLHPDPPPGAIVLLAQAAYHLDDYLPTLAHLEQHDVPAVIGCILPQPSLLRRWRSSWWRFEELLRRTRAAGLPDPVPAPAATVLATAGALVVRNDWGPSRVLVEQARSAGVPTVGWVEGVQDFADDDTGRARAAYRTVEEVLCLGPYDQQQLAGTRSTVVGSQHLWSCWHGEPTTADGPTVANVNFTYGVLEDARSSWVDDVVAARVAAPTGLVLSRHPADRGRRGRRLESPASVHDLLRRAPRLVSRFSTLCYEALALGVELTYHNPHGERVPTFARPEGAFVVTTDRAELLGEVGAPVRPAAAVREHAAAFLRGHLALDAEPAARAADLLASRRRTAPGAPGRPDRHR